MYNRIKIYKISFTLSAIILSLRHEHMLALIILY